MTLLVVTALGKTPDELYDRARLAAQVADWVEVRLDGPSGLPWDLRPFFQVGRPCLATVRGADEGGFSHADDETRANLLRRALKAGAAAIDVEMAHPEAARLVEEAHHAGAKALVSHHDLAGTPPLDDLVEHFRAGRRMGADWVKVAVTLRGPADAAALVIAARRAVAEGIPSAPMAVNDPVLRLVAPDLGLALAYASPPGAPPAAAGQVPADLLRAAWARRAPRRPPTGATRTVFLLGHPVAHSRSPAMQEAAFEAAGVDARYVVLDVAPGDLPAVFRALGSAGALGLNLTIPHKEAALSLVDEASADARAAGAVNTVVFRDGRATGHNTDGAGALDALAEAGVPVRGRDVLVLGAGGAARGIVHALVGAGARPTVANRTLARAQAVAAHLGAKWLPWDEAVGHVARFPVVVHATPVGLHGDETPMDPHHLLPGQALLEVVTRPGGTPLLRAARDRGVLAIPGEAMLLHQGARAFHLWTDLDAPLPAMRQALEAGL